MPHGYSLGLDDRRGFVYKKTHKNGDVTKVQGDKVGTQATGGTSWLLNVKDPNGNDRIGRFETKREAKKAAKRWMKAHPKGVESGFGGGSGGFGAADETMDTMGEATNSIFTGGGLFK